MSTLEERALADSDDSDRFTSGYGDAIESFVAQTRALVAVEAERDAARAALARVYVLIDPATQMAQPLYGSRFFDEADIRAALEPTP